MVVMGPLPTTTTRRSSNSNLNNNHNNGSSNNNTTSTGSRLKKHGNHNKNNSNNMTGANGAQLSYLLARGWTGRTSLPNPLNPLRADEMEKDLRHMQAYGQAAQAYQTQLYMQMNARHDMISSHHPHPHHMNTTNGHQQQQQLAAHVLSPAHHHHRHGATNVVTSLALPVRIDPDEEKRLYNLRKKIAAAEVLREQAEQEWVAHQAHYVHMAARLRHAQTQRAATAQTLQTAVNNKAAVVAQARLRLQMTRDVWNALKYRQERVGESVVVPTEANTVTTTSPPETAQAMDTATEAGTNSTASVAVPPKADQNENMPEDILTELWTQAEETYKRSCVSLVSGTEKEKTGKKKKATGQSQQSLIPWKGTRLTYTPTDTPVLVSVLSNVPDKTLAYGGGEKNMIWLPFHLNQRYPKVNDKDSDKEPMDTDVKDKMLTDDEEEDKLDEHIDEKNEALQKHLLELEEVLKVERAMNQEWSAKIAASRKSNDEWVSMMSLVRQETEALLHRHNILLESDKALAVSEELHSQEMEEQQAAAEQAAQEAASKEPEEGGTKDDDAGEDKAKSSTSKSGALDALTAAADQSTSLAVTEGTDPAVAADEANDGDDEGSEAPAEEEEDGEWPSATAGGGATSGKKRSVETTTANSEAREESNQEEEGVSKRRKVE